MTSSQYFPEINKITFEGTDTDNLLAFRYYDENRRVGDKTTEGAPALRHCLLAHLHQCRRRSLWTGHPGISLGTTTATPWIPLELASTPPLSFFTKITAPFYCLPRPRHCPGRQQRVRIRKKPTRNCATGQRIPAVHRRETAVRGTANLFSHPPLHERRLDQP